MESIISILDVISLALGMLAGLAGAMLFTTGISRRVTAASENAGRLGQRASPWCRCRRPGTSWDGWRMRW